MRHKRMTRTRHRNFLKVLRADLHLRLLHGVGFIFPMIPCHSFSTDLAVKVQTIEVGIGAIFVPPGAFVILQGTVLRPLVIITVLGGKCHTTMITKRISSSPCVKNMSYELVRLGLNKWKSSPKPFILSCTQYTCV